MAQYTIKHTCGHTKVHRIFGTNSHGERDRKQEWLANQICYDCYKAQQQAEREAKTAESAKINAEAGLPALQGTEKQIAWAETIRAEKFKELNEWLEKLKKYKESHPNPTETALRDYAIMAEIEKEMRSNIGAKDWIEMQNVTLKDRVIKHLKVINNQ